MLRPPLSSFLFLCADIDRMPSIEISPRSGAATAVAAAHIQLLGVFARGCTFSSFQRRQMRDTSACITSGIFPSDLITNRMVFAKNVASVSARVNILRKVAMSASNMTILVRDSWADATSGFVFSGNIDDWVDRSVSPRSFGVVFNMEDCTISRARCNCRWLAKAKRSSSCLS